jgi:hypothetical protein
VRQYVALRKTIVREGVKHLPRPKVTQDVLFIGDQEKCQMVIDQAAELPNNQSTDQIIVDLYVQAYKNHKSHTSRTGKENNGRL